MWRDYDDDDQDDDDLDDERDELADGWAEFFDEQDAIDRDVEL